eukprot:TRINITY_DN60342_c0_g1_i1.p1 TRINITY_DN60342_c0_g1~~TRINITY_DN60342_c0_g1_i1.p1  ORF type:complete len:222 (+),score=19.53 TRINITY_DN60342_c0_g1_i1:171-836(+)
MQTSTKSPPIWGPLTAHQACPMASGAASVIIASPSFVSKHNLWNRAVEIVAQAVASDDNASLNSGGYADLCGKQLARKAAQQVYQKSGATPSEVDVIEVHDCFSCNEFMMYEALGLCSEGKAGDLIDNATWTKANKGKGVEQLKVGSKWVVNPSGGLSSRGHAIGATGVAQCVELVTQLRGEAGNRQVDGAQTALQHNFGLGSAAVVSLYRKAKAANAPKL